MRDLSHAAERLALLDAEGRDRAGLEAELLRLHEELAEVRARHAEALRHNELLSEAGKLLASSLDPEETLRQVAHLVVPALGDWCAIDVLHPDGSVEQVVAAHIDPEKEAFARALRLRHPVEFTRDEGMVRVLQTGVPLLVPEMSDELLDRSTMPPDFREGIRRLGLRSVMIVALQGASGPLGALTLVAAESGRRYGPADLTLAEKLASRATMALENARLVRSLRQEHEEKVALLEATGDGICGIDVAGRCTFVNGAAARMVGREREALLGAKLFELAGLEPVAAAGLEAVRTGSEVRVEGWLRRATDEQLPVALAASPILRGEEVCGAVVSCVDLTARRLAEENERQLLMEQAARAAAEAAQEQLRQGRAALAEAQAIAGLGSWSWDVRTNVVSWSDELYRIYGRDPGSFSPSVESFLDTLVQEDREDAARFLGAALERGGPSAADIRIVRPDGTIRTLQCRREVQHENGVPVRMVGTCLDVTERKQVEQVLQQNAEELARSNAELERFAYVASHDLQEPLRMVASYVQLLARRYGDRLDADARDFIGYAVEGVTRMQRLIEDLLAYSRVEKRARQFTPVEAGTVAQRALRNLQIAIEESGAVVEVGALPLVSADEVQLLQLFQNLIGNGIKFRREEQPTIRVIAVPEGDAFRFTVRDNGIGIEEVYFDRIFLLFQRLHAREEYPGTGIGLAICKKIVERHGGRIWVESEPGRGSAFHFTLQGAAAR